MSESQTPTNNFLEEIRQTNIRQALLQHVLDEYPFAPPQIHFSILALYQPCPLLSPLNINDVLFRPIPPKLSLVSSPVSVRERKEETHFPSFRLTSHSKIIVARATIHKWSPFNHDATYVATGSPMMHFPSAIGKKRQLLHFLQKSLPSNRPT